MRTVLLIHTLALSTSVFAVTNCPPSGNCGYTNVENQPQVYYPQTLKKSKPESQETNPKPLEENEIPGSSQPFE